MVTSIRTATQVKPEIKRLRVIVNPVSGTNREALDTIKKLLDAHGGLEYEISLTENGGDATRFAQEAAKAGVDAVVVCGGDGTVMETADGLRDTSVPLVILPGGTANVMSIELGIPQTLGAAFALMWDDTRILRAVDMGSIDNTYFFLRAGIGYEAEISATAPREEKKRWGRLAYFRHALRKIRSTRPVRYTLTLDGKTVVTRGVTCMICNSGNIGLPNLKLAAPVDVSDGLLDVIVIRSLHLGEAFKVIGSTLGSILPFLKSKPPLIEHWQAREITVEMKRRQMVAYDGEALKRAKRVSAHAVPGAVQVLVPASTVSQP